MTFRITGSGFYVNRRGEKVEIVCYDRQADFWVDSNGKRYTLNGTSRRIDCYDIVGVWKEVAQEVPKLGIDQHTAEYLNTAKVPPEEEAEMQAAITGYNLTKISERFRALEDGRSLKFKEDNVFNINTIRYGLCDEISQFVGNSWHWSLIPLTRTITTRLWVYRTSNTLETYVCRSENGLPHDGEVCLGAIEGSGISDEVEI